MPGTSNIVRIDKLRAIAGTGAAGPGVIPSTFSSDSRIGFYTTPTVPAPFTHAMRVLRFINDTNGCISVSFDSLNDNLVILPNSFLLYDLTSDQDTGEGFRYISGTQIYIRYISAPSVQLNSTNTFYLEAIYGLGE